MIIAVDPGLSGGVAKVDDKGKFIACFPMPKKWVNETRREIDGVALTELLKDATLVVVERSRSFPGQGVASCYRIGENAGVIRGVCAALHLPMVYVEARIWKKYYNLPGGKDNKPLAISRAIDLYPMAPLTGNKIEGMSEALLMARWYCNVMTPSQSSGSAGRAKATRSPAIATPR